MWKTINKVLYHVYIWSEQYMDSNYKLRLKISNTVPLDLTDLAIGLNSLARLYNDFNEGNAQAKLLVKEVRKGSIEIDLITLSAASLIPLISNVNNIVQFASYLKLLCAMCLGAKGEEIKRITADNYLPSPQIKDFKNFKDTINILGNPGDVIKIDAIDNNTGNIFVGCEFNGIQAEHMRNNINQITKEKENNLIYTKQLFKWAQVNFNSTKTGNQGLIENITIKPLRVIFDDDRIKDEMMVSSDGIEWHNKFYIVDVEVLAVDGKPCVYKILKNHSEDSFSQDEWL